MFNWFKPKPDPLVEAKEAAKQAAELEIIQAWQHVAETMKNVATLLSELKLEKEVVEVVRTSQIEIPERKGIQEPNQAVEHIARMILAKDKDFRRHDPAWKDHFLNTIHHNVTANYPSMAFSVNQIEAVFDRLIGAGV